MSEATSRVWSGERCNQSKSTLFNVHATTPVLDLSKVHDIFCILERAIIKKKQVFTVIIFKFEIKIMI